MDEREEVEFDEIWEELNPQERECLIEMGIFFLEYRAEKKSEKAIMAISKILRDATKE
jgi:hypothetical protein